MGPTWGPPGSCRPHVGPIMAPWTLLSGPLYPVCLSNPLTSIVSVAWQILKTSFWCFGTRLLIVVCFILRSMIVPRNVACHFVWWGLLSLSIPLELTDRWEVDQCLQRHLKLRSITVHDTSRLWCYKTATLHLRSTLQWCHNGGDGVSNHQPQDCLLNRLFRRRSKKTSKLSITGLCVGNSPVTGEFPAQMASDAENVSIWWRHHDLDL